MGATNAYTARDKAVPGLREAYTYALRTRTGRAQLRDAYF